MPSLHFLLAAAKEGDKDALLGLQGPVGGNGGGGGGGGYSQGQLHTRHRSSIDDLGYEDSLRSGSNSNTSSNNTSTKNNNNNNVEGIVNSSMCANTLEGHQGMQSKNNASDWLMSGSDTFRSVGSTATTDADIFSYQLPVKPPMR